MEKSAARSIWKCSENLSHATKYTMCESPPQCNKTSRPPQQRTEPVVMIKSELSLSSPHFPSILTPTSELISSLRRLHCHGNRMLCRHLIELTSYADGKTLVTVLFLNTLDILSTLGNCSNYFSLLVTIEIFSHVGPVHFVQQSGEDGSFLLYHHPSHPCVYGVCVCV